MRLNVFRGARDKTPIAQDDLTWPELVRELEAMVSDEADPGDPRKQKLTLLAVTFGPLREPYNKDENVVALDALAIDVDTCDANEIGTRILAMRPRRAAFIYASPSDPNPDGSRRVRVIAPLSTPLEPEHVKHARHAFAEMLGIGPGQGVENADAVSQVMFAGRLHGTPERETWTFAGEPIDTAELVGAELTHAWPTKASKAKARAASAADMRFDAAPDARTEALVAALLEHWEEPDTIKGRRGTLRALGGYLARRGWPDDQIVAVARALPTARPESVRVATVLECAREARVSHASAGWSSLVNWNPAAAGAIENAAKDPREPADWPGVWSEWWAAYLAKRAARVEPLPVHEPAVASEPAHEPDTFAPASDDADEPGAVPMFLRSRNGHVTLMWEGDARGHRPIADKIIRTRLLELGYADSIVQMRGAGGKPVSVETILEAHSESYTNTSYAFHERLTKHDPRGEGSVQVGYPETRIAARFDADADAWLRALGGQHYDRLAVWIASCVQEHINRLAACVILMGRADVGKTMFGHAVAALWGQTPPPMSLVAVTFNADLLRCPILVDEEAQLFGSKSLSTKRFRDIVQASTRSVELKGKERCELVGAMRGIVPCNGYSDLRFSDLGGPAVIEALRDRMLVIDCTRRADACKGPLERLRLPGDHLVDLSRVTGHMAWLAETIELPAERFLGAGGDGSESAIMAGHTHETAELWATLEDWLDGAADSPWYAHETHGLCVDARALASALEASGRGWDLPRVHAAIAPFRTGAHRLGTAARTRVVGLDGLRVAGALDLDDEALEALMARLGASEPAPVVAARGGKFAGFKR